MKRLAPVVLVLMTACAPPTMTSSQKLETCGGAPSEGEALAAVQVYIDRGGLKDPFSAQTRDIRVEGMGYIQNGFLRGGARQFGWIVSFDLNAKNSFGAYVGWRRRYLIWNNGQSYWMVPPSGMEPGPPSRL